MITAPQRFSVSSFEGDAVARQPVIDITHFTPAGPGFARVVCSVTHAGNSREDASIVARSLEQKLEGKLKPVSGSFSALSSGRFSDVITGLVTVAREAIPMTDNMNGFRSISSNMFMDEEEHMWKVEKSAAGSLLVKSMGIDDDLGLLSLLQKSVSSSGFNNLGEHNKMVAMASATAAKVQGGDFVTFVDPDAQITCGYVVATASTEGREGLSAVIVEAVTGEEMVVSTAAVTDIHDPAGFPEVKWTPEEQVAHTMSLSRGNADINTLLAYYKKVYARGPKFYEEFAKRIKNHAFGQAA